MKWLEYAFALTMVSMFVIFVGLFFFVVLPTVLGG